MEGSVWVMYKYKVWFEMKFLSYKLIHCTYISVEILHAGARL